LSRGVFPGSFTSTFGKISQDAHWYHDVQCRIDQWKQAKYRFRCFSGTVIDRRPEKPYRCFW
jgi:hypothetical protein